MDGPLQVRLSGGHLLAVEEFGDPDGVPVLYCHGTPDSRVSAILLDDAAAAASVRLLAVDRPGIGGSTYQQRRRVRDWPEDVAALIGWLELDRFAVLGWRAGAAYALACAHDWPDRRDDAAERGGRPQLAATGVASPLPPPSVVRGSLGLLSRAWYDLVSYLPFARYPGIRRTARRLAADPTALVRAAAERGPPADRQALRRTADRQGEAHRRAFRQGLLGPLRDVTLQHRGWGFRPEGVTRHVHLWHGREDPVVPPARADRLAERLPDCTPRFYEGDGHVSVLVDRGEEILQTLAATVREQAPRAPSDERPGS